MRLARLLNQMKEERPLSCGLVDAPDGSGGRVIVDPRGELPQQAIELRARLALLAEEQMAARECGLAMDRAYAEDLALDVDDTRFAHAGAVVFQVAFMRAATGGRTQG